MWYLTNRIKKGHRPGSGFGGRFLRNVERNCCIWDLETADSAH